MGAASIRDQEWSRYADQVELERDRAEDVLDDYIELVRATRARLHQIGQWLHDGQVEPRAAAQHLAALRASLPVVGEDEPQASCQTREELIRGAAQAVGDHCAATNVATIVTVTVDTVLAALNARTEACTPATRCAPWPRPHTHPTDVPV